MKNEIKSFMHKEEFFFFPVKKGLLVGFLKKKKKLQRLQKPELKLR